MLKEKTLVSYCFVGMYDLIAKMLVRNSKQRIPLLKISEHPWMRRNEKCVSVGKRSFENLSKEHK